MTMNPSQRAVLELAQKNGLTPMEQSAEFMLHDLVQACLDVLRSQKKVFSDQGEQQQDSIISEITSRLKKTVYTAASILQGADVTRVPMILQDFKAGKDLKLMGIIAADDPGRYELMDKAHAKSPVTILLQDMNYFEGMSNVQADKDQKALPLDQQDQTPEDKPKRGRKPAQASEQKAVSIPAKTLEQAREFVVIQQNGRLAALQNFLKCDITKAKAIMEILADEGLVGEPDEQGNREIVRSKSGTVAPDYEGSAATEEDQDAIDGLYDEEPATELTDDLYSQIRAAVVATQSVSEFDLISDHALSPAVARTAMERLELDGVISEEDELGGRSVLLESIPA